MSPNRSLHTTPVGSPQFRFAVHGFWSGVCEFCRSATETRHPRTMKRCKYCNSLIVIGGVGRGKLRFCNSEHERAAYYLERAEAIPSTIIDDHVREMHGGQCPRCQGRGPVDVFSSHRVWSALLFTTWSTREHVCCRSCSIRSQLGDALFSLCLGWWGFPWGFIVTPIQIARNLWSIAFPPDYSSPSAMLRKRVAVSLGRTVGNQSKT